METKVNINNETKVFGSRRAALAYIRDFIRKERRKYRIEHNLPDNVHALMGENATGIALVDTATYNLDHPATIIAMLNDFGINASMEEINN